MNNHNQKLNKVIELYRAKSSKKIYYKRFANSPFWWVLNLRKIIRTKHTEARLKSFLAEEDTHTLRLTKPKLSHSSIIYQSMFPSL